MIESLERLPGAALKPNRQRTTWPYAPVKEPIPRLIADDADTVLSTALDTSEREAVEPHQHTIVEDHLKDWTSTIKCMNDVEVDRLINIIESIKLERALKRRAEVERLMDQAHKDISSHEREWIALTRAIGALTSRAVQS